MITLIADTHSHTIASNHAYSTIEENVRQAAAAGLKVLAVTDHGPAAQDSPHPWYFLNLHNVPREIMGVKVLRGAEANLLDYDGNIDLEEPVLEQLDWIIASVHSGTFPQGTEKDHTNAYLSAAKNPHIDVIGHSGYPNYRYDYERCIKAFREYGKLVEINQNTFQVRQNSVKNCAEIARICKKHRVPVVVNSDAHIAYNIGKVPDALKMLEEIDFPEELILNANLAGMHEYLYQKRGISII